MGVATLCIWGVLFMHGGISREMRVAFLDVGQGDAIFIEAPNGTQVLIDGGPDRSVLRGLGKEMRFFDRSIDIVIMTHPDMDHIGGLPDVLERFDVGYVVTSGIAGDTGAYEAFIEDVRIEGAHTVVSQGQRIWLDREEGVCLDMLFPDRELSDVETNTGSIVAKLTYGETSFLLTGDAPQSIEDYMVMRYGTRLDVDVLKLGHHGSRTSTSETFLAVTSPSYAVVSAGADNTYGHPHREVLDLLTEYKIAVVSTADEGTVAFTSDGIQVTREE